MKLTGKVAIITGAGNGIGREIAREFAVQGAKVVVSDCDNESGSETVELIKKEKLDAVFIQANLPNESDIDRIVSSAVENFGRIDILVNNAGVGGTLSSLADITIEEWDSVIGVNLKAPFLLAKKVLPEMLKAGKGNVINIASMAAYAAGRGGVAYTASKHGLIGLTRQISMMHGHQGIRVNSICPGPIETRMIKRLLEIPEHPLCQKIKASPAGRAGQAEEVAKLALFLASDDSDFIHGASFNVDGGYTIF